MWWFDNHLCCEMITMIMSGNTSMSHIITISGCYQNFKYGNAYQIQLLINETSILHIILSKYVFKISFLSLRPRFSPVWTNIGIINSVPKLNNWLKIHHESIEPMCKHAIVIFKSNKKVNKDNYVKESIYWIIQSH